MSYNKLIEIEGKIATKRESNRIKAIEKTSVGYKAGLREGDVILKINGEKLKDIIDYRFLTAEESLDLLVERNEEEFNIKIEKDTYEDLGVEFGTGLIDKANRCSNQCIFCFIDQLPQGIRESLYFKDDDSRLSFLQGNFVTLTNMTKSDIDRIIKYRISPINISVHTTNPELRVKMLGNRNAGNVYERMQQLAENRISMKAQIVLVPGFNDKEELTGTLKDLSKLHPFVSEVAIVPLGLTKYRENLTKLTAFTKASARNTISQVKELNKEFIASLGTNFARCADEFYVLGEVEIPEEDYYEGYEQIEDGIGMIRLFRESTEFSLNEWKDEAGLKGKDIKGEMTFLTGTSAFKEIDSFKESLLKEFPKLKANCHCIENDFFGPSITVAGLLTGKDILNQLRGRKIYKNLIMPRNMFRASDDVMLDDIRIEDLERELSTKILVVDYTGEDLIDKIKSILE